MIKQLESRAVEVTFPPLVQAGMSKFMWVSPSEQFYSNAFQHGGFMYYFKDGSSPVILPLGSSSQNLAFLFDVTVVLNVQVNPSG